MSPLSERQVAMRSFTCLIWAKSLPAFAESFQKSGDSVSFSFSFTVRSRASASKTPPDIDDLGLKVRDRLR
jgi:hypothetical protein